MGYDERQQPNSSGTLVAVIGVGLVLAILAFVAVAGAALFWVRTDVVQMQAVANEQRATEAQLTKAEAQRAVLHVRIKDGMVQIQQPSIAATPDSRLNFVLERDREGNMSVDDEMIGLDELNAKLVKLKDETSNVFRVRINADPDCPIKLVVPVLEVLDEVGDIDYRIVASKASDTPRQRSRRLLCVAS